MICGNNIDDNYSGVIEEGCCNIAVDAGLDKTTYFGFPGVARQVNT